MIFQCACQDFPYWRIVVPHSIQKIQLFSLPGESPTTIWLPTPFLAKQKNQTVRTILHPIFLPLPVKTLLKQNFQLSLNVQFFSSS